MENLNCGVLCNNYLTALTCEAYPTGIPDAILDGKDNHTKKRPDQFNDVVFESKKNNKKIDTKK